MSRILMLPKWYPDKFSHTEGIFIVDHIKSINRHHDVFTIYVRSDHTLKTSREVIFSQKKGYAELIVYFRKPKTGIGLLDSTIAGIRYIIEQYRAFKTVITKWGMPDYCHIHVLSRPAFLALYLKWRYAIPFFISEHWTGYNPDSGKEIRALKKVVIQWIIGFSSGISAVSSYLKLHIEKIISHRNFKVISNTIDQRVFCQRSKISESKTRFIHISTLSDNEKNFGELLYVIQKVAQINPNFELHVYGGGEEAKKQYQRAQKLKLKDRFVFFHGKVKKEVVAKELSRSDAMLMFSNWETQSCVLLESFMCGVPAIATSVGGAAEILNDLNSIALPKGDKEALKESILYFLSNNKIFDSDKIRQHAMRHNYHEVGMAFDDFYQNGLPASR